jgi:predicted component of type VI protein secretion system
LLLRKTHYAVGRFDARQGCFPEIDLTVFDPECSVSRKHAHIRQDQGVFFLDDLGSMNATCLKNDTGITGVSESQRLEHGAVILFGNVKAEFRYGSAENASLSKAQKNLPGVSSGTTSQRSNRSNHL